MKATRHCGRSGKHGVYNPKHNDRRFDLKNSDHIDEDRAKQNVYWDVYQGLSFPGKDKNPNLPEMTFSQVESAYYCDKYYAFTVAQNERNEKSRHPERNRTTDDILRNKKTCPEETLYQLGNVDDSVPGEKLATIAAEFFEDFEKRYGEHIHILDWALHLDEGTPHIHERHVFDAENKYGELCPQQDEALRLLGFDLPNPNKPQGKFNNRKMTFDKVCRERFLEICERNGVFPDLEPVYGGKTYLEKQDYIIEKQKKQLKELEEKIEETEAKLSDGEALIEEVSAVAYKNAVELVTSEVVMATRNADLAAIDDYKIWLSSDERNAPKEKRDYAIARLDKVKQKIINLGSGLINKIIGRLTGKDESSKNTEIIAEKTKESFRDRIAEAKRLSEEANKLNVHKKKRHLGLDSIDD